MVRVTSPAVVLLAGLCSVPDWIGSNADWFKYATAATDRLPAPTTRTALSVRRVSRSMQSRTVCLYFPLGPNGLPGLSLAVLF